MEEKEEDIQPVKRGRGRPRKYPLPGEAGIAKPSKKEAPIPTIGFKTFTFNRAVEAWEKINEMFLLGDPALMDNTVGMNGYLTNTQFAYNVSLVILEQKFDPNFDFGKYFYYSMSKWSGLLGNYINLDMLDEFKTRVRELEKDRVKIRYYAQGFHFSDSHENGKGCILSGIFSRQLGVEKPILTVYIRSSEVTTRLPIDLLFFQRLGTYVYGHRDFITNVVIKQMYADDSIQILYHKYKDLYELMKDAPEERKQKVFPLLDKVLKGDSKQFANYGPSLRVYRVLHPEDSDTKEKTLLAKQCVIGNWDGIPLPKVCPSILERNRIKALYLKFINKYHLDIDLGKAIDNGKKKKKKVIKISNKTKTEEEE